MAVARAGTLYVEAGGGGAGTVGAGTVDLTVETRLWLAFSLASQHAYQYAYASAISITHANARHWRHNISSKQIEHGHAWRSCVRIGIDGRMGVRAHRPHSKDTRTHQSHAHVHVHTCKDAWRKYVTLAPEWGACAVWGPVHARQCVWDACPCTNADDTTPTPSGASCSGWRNDGRGARRSRSKRRGGGERERERERGLAKHGSLEFRERVPIATHQHRFPLESLPDGVGEALSVVCEHVGCLFVERVVRIGLEHEELQPHYDALNR